MASISIRKLDENIYQQLKIRAEQHSISMEAEARRIISDAVVAPVSLADLFHQCFGSKNGVDHVELHDPHAPHEPLDLR